jgi:FemAB-related protein (PEP-CTERM system-associated)
MVEIKSPFFGHSFVSMPFSDIGGFDIKNENIEKELFKSAVGLMKINKADVFEIRMSRPLDWLEVSNEYIDLRMHKVRMVLDLPFSVSELESSFKSKLRSQIKRPIKEGMYSIIGKHELIHDFYHVFSMNMRDLGSPVHSKKLFYHIFDEFAAKASIIMIYTKKREPVAGGLIIGHGRCLSNPWASSLREYRSSSPNMFLYWAMLKYAICEGYCQFDFGRSTPGEGTHLFKQQWGAVEQPLYWYSVHNKKCGNVIRKDKPVDMREMMEKIWSKLPLSLANFIGPHVRGNISL